MPDLNVVAVIVAKPGSEATVGAALAALVEPTRAEEGCLSYELYESEADPTTFITVELWRSQADLDQHTTSPHLRAALESAGDALAATPAIHPLKSYGA